MTARHPIRPLLALRVQTVPSPRWACGRCPLTVGVIAGSLQPVDLVVTEPRLRGPLSASAPPRRPQSRGSRVPASGRCRTFLTSPALLASALCSHCRTWSRGSSCAACPWTTWLCPRGSFLSSSIFSLGFFTWQLQTSRAKVSRFQEAFSSILCFRNLKASEVICSQKSRKLRAWES